MKDAAAQRIGDIRAQEAEKLARLLSARHNLPYIDLTRITIELDALKLIPEATARTAQVAAFRRVGDNVQVAVVNPDPEATERAIRDLKGTGRPVTLYIASALGVKRAVLKYAEISQYKTASRGIVDISIDRVREVITSATSFTELQKLWSGLVADPEHRRASELLEVLVGGAIATQASDAHLEPQTADVRLRFRIDGMLHDIFAVTHPIYALLLSRIKIVSGLKLNIYDQAQDGRFTIKLPESEIEVRTSVIPENYGESVVMRILNPQNIAVPFEELGIEPHLQEVLLREIRKPNGMVLTTGPTGSGKTTTLYAFLRKKQSSDIKIITLEDPIEYHLQGIVQTQVEEKRGYTFASGLRSILRQDPDVIMVGEIRDTETAQIATNAALTGHLVLSTLHANDAAGTIPRLLDLGVTPAALAPALCAMIAQRLIRLLCPKCKREVRATPEERKRIDGIVASLPERYKSALAKTDVLFKPAEHATCDACGGIGYKGRIGIYEVIVATEEIRALVLKTPNQIEIVERAKNQGTLSMAEDGIIKVLGGITSLEELERVVELPSG